MWATYWRAYVASTLCIMKRLHCVSITKTAAVSVRYCVICCSQSYDVDIEVSIAGSGVTSSNTLDLKNPCFRYTGQPVQAPPGTNNTSPTDAYWASLQDGTGKCLSGISVNMQRGDIQFCYCPSVSLKFKWYSWQLINSKLTRYLTSQCHHPCSYADCRI